MKTWVSWLTWTATWTTLGLSWCPPSLICFSVYLFDLFWGSGQKETAESWATAPSRPVIQCQAGSRTRWIGGPSYTKGARDPHRELTLTARLQATNCTPGTLLLCHQCVFVWVRDCVSPADTICSVLCELVHILSLYTSSVPVFSLSIQPSVSSVLRLSSKHTSDILVLLFCTRQVYTSRHRVSPQFWVLLVIEI